MSLLNFFKKKKPEDILIPKICPAEIPAAIINQVDVINWAEFETAYGNAEQTIPFYLKNLFCTNAEIAMDATHQLWCSLCHQHAYVSSAALPAYDILKTGLKQSDDLLKVELLDIFLGFARCTNPAFLNEKATWEFQLREKLLNDRQLFEYLMKHHNEDISGFSERIVDALQKK